MSALKIVARVFLRHFAVSNSKINVDTVAQNLKALLPIYHSEDESLTEQELAEEITIFTRAMRAWLGESEFCPERLCLALDPIRMETFASNLGLDITQATPALVDTFATLIYSYSEVEEESAKQLNTQHQYENLYISGLL